MKSPRQAVVVAIVSALALGSAGEVAAQPEPITVDLKRPGFLVDGGQAAEVRVAVVCRPGNGDVLEAFVLLDQGSTSGHGGIAGIVCDGRRRTFTVRVTAFDGPYQRGPARGDAFVLVCDEAGNCVQGEDIEQVNLRPQRRE